MDAYNEGYDAGLEGWTNMNPFPVGSLDYDEYEDGFFDGMNDSKAEFPE